MVYTLSGVRFPTIPSSASDKLVRSSFPGDRRISRLSFFSRNRSFSRKILAGRSAYDSESPSSAVAASEKILVPGSESDASESPSAAVAASEKILVLGTESDASSSSTEQLETVQMALEDPSQVSSDVDVSEIGSGSEIESEENYIYPADEGDGEQDYPTSSSLHVDGKVKSVGESDVEEMINSESEKVQKRTIPLPGSGQRIYEIDPLLRNFSGHLDYRFGQYKKMREAIDT